MSATGSAASLGHIIQHQRHITDYVYVSANALLIYDYLLMLRLEIELIWPSPWSYTKILYLLSRYLPLANFGLVLYNQVFLNNSVEICRVTWPIAVWLYAFELVFAETILAIRTWAIWGKNRKVGIGLALLTIVNLIFQCIITSRYVKSAHYGPGLYPGYRGCFVRVSSRILLANYGVMTVVETAVLVLMVISGIRAYRSGSRNKLSDVIYRDGILLYVYLLFLSAANFFSLLLAPVSLSPRRMIVFIDLWPQPEFMTMMTAYEDVFYSVLTSRIIVNIRNVSRGDVIGITTELHDLPSAAHSTVPQMPLELKFHRDGTRSQSVEERDGEEIC